MKIVWFFLTAILLIPIATYDIYALQQIAGKITIEIKPGETKSFQWGLISDEGNPITIGLSAMGSGSEFLSFEKSIILEPKQIIYANVTVTIPRDHPGGRDLNPSVYATQFGEQDGSTILNIQMKKILSIIIAENDNQEFRTNTANDQPEQKSNETPSNIVTKAPSEKGETFITNTQSAKQEKTPLGGGCLIATATYGSELAPQVQQLRELRDNSLLQTESGTSFIAGFNQFYYSFSPTIADWERESPAFKEFVKITLTPMISSLSILNYVDMDSEISVLGYGISLIMLNVGMYFVAPVIVIHTIRKKV
jgi:hypothetical protein